MSSINFLLEKENQMVSEMEMTNLSREAEYNEHLAKSLKEIVTKSMREFKASCRAEKKKKVYQGTGMNTKKNLSSIQRPENVDSSMLGPRKGRKVKNEVVAEKTVTFSLPANFDIATISASDIDKVKERLGKWRIQRRQRDTKASDTFYCHLSSRKIFRSISKVVNFIMYGTHPQLPKQTSRKRKLSIESKTLIDSPTDQLGQKDENPNESFSCESPSLMQLLNTNLEEEDFRNDRYFCVRDTFMLEKPQDLEASCSQPTIDEILPLEYEPSKNNDDHNLPFSGTFVKNIEQENNVNGVTYYNSLEADDRFDLTMKYRQEMIMGGGGGNHEGMMMMNSGNENAGFFMDIMNDGLHGDVIVEATKAMENEEVHEGFVNVGETIIDQVVIDQEEGLQEQLPFEFWSDQEWMNNIEEERNGSQHNPPEFNKLSMSFDEVGDDYFNFQSLDDFLNNNN